MPILLHIETATTICSVALSKDGKLLTAKENNEGYTHSENLTVFIQAVLDQAGVSFSQLDAIAVSKGPGSYTGLRIGVSTAKGLCYALDKPLIAVDTLHYMAGAFEGEGLRVPMIDARRMEVYCAVYNGKGEELEPIAARIITPDSFSGLLETQPLCFLGDGAAKCQAVITHSNASFYPSELPSAVNMIGMAEQAFSEKQFEDLAYFEPFYLKEFVAGVKKKNPAQGAGPGETV